MIEMIGVATLLFLCFLLAFAIGLKLGTNASKGIMPEVNPIKIIADIKENIETKKDTDKLDQELTDIMGATKESMLESLRVNK